MNEVFWPLRNLSSEADVEPQFCSGFPGQPMILMSSFDEIYERHVKAVFRVALRAVSRREIAEEITSEVFLALHQNWEHIDHEQLPAWLFTVAKRRAADYWRRWYLEDRWALAPQVEQVWQEPEIPLPTLLAKCPNLKPIHRTCIILSRSPFPAPAPNRTPKRKTWPPINEMATTAPESVVAPPESDKNLHGIVGGLCA